MTADLYIGLMSGTSMDGIDAVLVGLDDSSFRVHHAINAEYAASLGDRLRDIAHHPDDARVDDLGALHIAVAHAFAAAACRLMNEAGVAATDVAAIGSHGQTVLHRPDDDHPFSLQLGDPGTLSARTEVAVVADFRTADIALGGQGAPLVPAFHRWAFGHSSEHRAAINIGGIANVTLLDPAGATTGHDTGPGNVLLDQWCRENTGAPFDAGGQWAATGTVDDALLQLLLADDYFARPAPKSTGTDYFNRDWLRAQLNRFSGKTIPSDVQATLSELTAQTIVAAIPEARTAAVCGGGAHNDDLMKRLQRLLQPRKISSTADWGADPDWVEAVAFAWLARQRLKGEPSNVPSVTGARAAVSLGGVYLPPGRGQSKN